MTNLPAVAATLVIATIASAPDVLLVMRARRTVEVRRQVPEVTRDNARVVRRAAGVRRCAPSAIPAGGAPESRPMVTTVRAVTTPMGGGVDILPRLAATSTAVHGCRCGRVRI